MFRNICSPIILALLLNALAYTLALAQPASSRNDATRSSRGKDFYFTFMPNYHEQPRDSANTRDSLFVFITSDKPVTGRITYRNRAGQVFVQPFNLADPTQIYSFSLNYGQFELEGFNTGGFFREEGIQNERPALQTFRVEASDEVTVYALNQARFTSDAMLVYPVPALGREYMVMAYNSDGSGRSFLGTRPDNDTPSQFAVVATEDNTEVTITPRVPTFPPSGFLIITAASVQRVTLQRGQAYLVQADTRLGIGIADLTGSRISATKPIAVFGGHQRTVLPISLRAELSSRDCLLEQLPSIETWGKSIFLVPHAQPSQQAAFGTDLYRVLAAYDNTIVSLNGVPIDTLRAGEFVERQLIEPGWITASDQVLVAQFKKSSNVRGGIGIGTGSGANLFGDPFMMVIPTVEQYDKGYRFINVRIPDPGVRNGLVFTEHFATIVIPANAVNTVFVDERAVPASAFRPIVNSQYSFVNINLEAGTHTARADSAFGLYVYGYGAANSYGYIGGGKLRVIAPDRDAPRVSLRPECFGLSGTLIDTLITDSRIARVSVQPSTLANVQVSVEQFTPFVDSVRFSARLVNQFQDGNIALEARDSVGFITRRTLPIYGFTVGLVGQGSSNTAPERQFELPTGRSRIFPVVLTNYGATAHTITGIQFLQGGLGMRINRTFPLVLAAGASDTLRISYTALQDGIITDTLAIVSTCATRAVARISISAMTDRTPPIITAQQDPCGQIVTLQATEQGTLASGMAAFTATNLVNASFRLDSISVVRFLGRITVLNPRLDAIYTVQARDSAGNVRVLTDTIQGFTVAALGLRDSIGRFPATNISGTTACITVQYRNVGLKPFVFESFAPQGNQYFSIPISQLPFVIRSGETRNIRVCFSPNELRTYRDTLILRGNCLGDTLVLEGVGISTERLLNSRCDVPIILRTISTPTSLAILNTAPNPSSGKTSLALELSDAAWISVHLYSAQGVEMRTLYDGYAEQGTSSVEFDTSGLEQGVYFCAVQAGAKRVTRQIVVVK